MWVILLKTWLWYHSAQRQIMLTRYVAEKAYMRGMREWTYFCPLVVVSITKDLCAFVSRAISLNRQKNLHEGILAVFCILCILTLCFKKFVDGSLSNLYICVKVLSFLTKIIKLELLQYCINDIFYYSKDLTFGL